MCLQRRGRFFWEAPKEASDDSPSVVVGAEENAELEQLTSRLKLRAVTLAGLFVSEGAAPSLLTALLEQLLDLPDLELPLTSFSLREVKKTAPSSSSTRTFAADFGAAASDGSPRELRHLTISSNPLSPSLVPSSVLESNEGSEGASSRNPFGTLQEREPRVFQGETASGFADGIASSSGDRLERGGDVVKLKAFEREEGRSTNVGLQLQSPIVLPESVNFQVESAVSRALATALQTQRLRSSRPCEMPRPSPPKNLQDPQDGFRCKARLLRFLFAIAVEHFRQHRLAGSLGKAPFNGELPQRLKTSLKSLASSSAERKGHTGERLTSRDSRASSGFIRLGRRRSCAAVAKSSENGHRKRGRLGRDAQISTEGTADEAAGRSGGQRRAVQTPESWNVASTTESSLRGGVSTLSLRMHPLNGRRALGLAPQFGLRWRSRVGAPTVSGFVPLPSQRPQPVAFRNRRLRVPQTRGSRAACFDLAAKSKLPLQDKHSFRASAGAVLQGEGLLSPKTPRKRARRTAEALAEGVSEETGRAVCALLSQYSLRLVFAAALCKDTRSPPVLYLRRFVSVLVSSLKDCLDFMGVGSEKQGHASVEKEGDTFSCSRIGTETDSTGKAKRGLVEDEGRLRKSANSASDSPPSLTRTFIDGVALPLLYGIIVLTNNPWQSDLLARVVRDLYALLRSVQEAVDSYPTMKRCMQCLTASQTKATSVQCHGAGACGVGKFAAGATSVFCKRGELALLKVFKCPSPAHLSPPPFRLHAPAVGSGVFASCRNSPPLFPSASTGSCSICGCLRSRRSQRSSQRNGRSGGTS